jgi:hypothetical protein
MKDEFMLNSSGEVIPFRYPEVKAKKRASCERYKSLRDKSDMLDVKSAKRIRNKSRRRKEKLILDSYKYDDEFLGYQYLL